MRTHEIAPDGDAVTVRELETEASPLLEMEGTQLDGVRLWQRETRWGRLELVELAVGASLPMHSGDQVIVCQVLSGRGRLGLPGGGELPFEAPHLFTFQPGALHSWHGIEQPVVLSICVVGGGS